MFYNIYRTIFNCVSSYSASLSLVRQAHAHIVKAGLFGNVQLTTRLLSVYANNLCFYDVNLVLDSIPEPDLFSFSTLIHAFAKLNHFDHVLRVFSQMLTQRLVPDCYVLPSAIKACAGLQDLKVGRQIHGVACVYGLALDSIVESSLVHMYLKCHKIGDAQILFDRMPEKDVVIWSAMIAGCYRQGLGDKAKELFYEMRNEGVEPNIVSWNGMIAGLCNSGSHIEGLMFFQMMISEGFRPDGSTISCVLPAIGHLDDLVMGTQVHGYVNKQGIGSDKFVVSALIDMYGRCACALEMSQVFDESDQMEIGSCNAFLTGLSRNGLVDTALDVFRRFKAQGMELNVVTWTSMIANCSQNGKDLEALEFFREMQSEGLEPNSITIPSLIPACGNIVALMHGKAIHCFSIRKGIVDDVYVGSALIDMYAKCGRIQLSRLCFDRMPTRNLVSWNAIMRGYAMHGKARETIDIFHMMQQGGQTPDFITFTCLLSACSQNGLTEEGWHYFTSMSTEHGIEAKMEHYACMVTLLGRVGKLEEAYSLIGKMPFQPDACVWGALLGSCRVHHNLSLGEIAAKKLFQLESDNPGNYILLSNIYASKGMWGEVNRIRGVMKNMGLRKNPGCSWIELGRKVHMLLAGDKSHPQMKLILEKLDQLSIEMNKFGYYPDTNNVLQDVEEQDKAQILCGHSEKLAVVLGVLNTSPGQPLQVIKNLRICDDCHAVIKFISSFEQREIYVRDTNRFHHFKNGVCSCREYW